MPAPNLLGSISFLALRAQIPGDDAAGVVENVNAVIPDTVHQHAIAGLDDAYLFFGLPAVVNVENHANHAYRASELVVETLAPECNPPRRPIGAHDAALKIEIVRFTRAAQVPLHVVSVVREYMLEEPGDIPLRLQFAVAEDAVVFKRSPDQAGPQIQVPRTHACSSQREAQLTLVRNLV